MNFFYRGKGLRALPGLLLAAGLVMPLAGCNTDEIVEVEDTAQLRPEDLDGLAAVPALVNGALRQFVGGYSGFGLDDSFLSASAVTTDEFYFGDTFPTRDAADRRSWQPAVLGNITDPSYARLHQARFNARRAFAVVEEFSTSLTAAADAVTKAQLRAIEGYVYVTLSEGWCGSVPFSKLPDIGPIDPTAIDYTAGLTTAQMSDTGIVRFNEALALNAGNNLAKVGKARALLNVGRYVDAAAAVATVPTTYVFRLQHSINEATQNNPIWALQSNGRYGISNLEGGLGANAAALRTDTSSSLTAPGGSAEGLPFRALQDPRIPYSARPNCFTTSIRCWLNNNYPNQDADVPLASGVEARLIEAEAALAAGDVGLMLTRLNGLRAAVMTRLQALYPDQISPNPFAVAFLPDLTDPGTPEARRAMLFQERALWLFNTGHRLGDLRRLVRNYGVPSTQAFPSGPFFRGGVYGNDVAFPVPFSEENNPNFNRAACVTTQA